MGKNSLIKSTSKKSAEEEEKKKTPKKAAAPKKKATKAKTTTAKKTTKAKKASTSKAAPKAEKTTKKKAAPKEKKAAAKKAAPKTKKAAPKTKKAAAPKAKKAAKKPTKAKPKKAAPKKKQMTLKELIFKTFDVGTPDKSYSPGRPAGTPKDVTSPPYFAATSDAELERLRGIQFRAYSAADLKTAAEKAGVDKAAAEKAAAEKAAAEKAATEKAAAEKAAAEKAVAEAVAPESVQTEPVAGVSYDPPPAAAEPADPMAKMFKYGIAGFAAVILLLIGTSLMNTGNFYLKAVDGSLEIWQGRFAPMGQDRLIVLSGMEAPAPIKEVYSKNEVYPLVFNFYVQKADELLAMPGMPDYEEIRTYLKKALAYASTPELQSTAYARLDSIEFMTLMIKTNVAVQKKTVDSLEEALGYLKETRALELDPEQAALVKSKTESIEKMIVDLKAQEAAKAEAEGTAGK